MIMRTRRRLLMAARALPHNGVSPPGAEDASVYREARSGYFTSGDKSPWREVYTKIGFLGAGAAKSFTRSGMTGH